MGRKGNVVETSFRDSMQRFRFVGTKGLGAQTISENQAEGGAALRKSLISLVLFFSSYETNKQ